MNKREAVVFLVYQEHLFHSIPYGCHRGSAIRYLAYRHLYVRVGRGGSDDRIVGQASIDLIMIGLGVAILIGGEQWIGRDNEVVTVCLDGNLWHYRG